MIKREIAHQIACQIVPMLDDSYINDNVSVNVEVEEIMKRSQIIKKYGGDIKKLPDGRYHIRHQGRQIFKKSYDLVIDEILKRETQKGVRTLDRIANDFFEYRFSTTAGGTYGKDKSNYETFIKGTELAQKDITKIALNDGVKWANHCLTIKPDMKEKYFKNVRGTLNKMLNYAVDNQWIPRNLIANVSIHKDHLTPKAKHTDTELVFEDWEQKSVCKYAYEDSMKTKSGVPLGIPFLFLTGIRDGELCALKWRDIEEQGLHIQAEMVECRDKDGKFKGYKYVEHTKTAAGDRIILISSAVANILKKVKDLNIANGFSVNQDDFIFLRTYNNKVCECTTRSFETRIKKYCRKAKMSILKSQHDVRRTFATNLYYKGLNEKEIQALMGHESLEQTLQYIKRKDANVSVISFLEALSSGADIQNVI